jgi:alanyl-tRNA synthetase
MKADEIREAFLKYFEDHGHQRVASASLQPDDSSLLFTNAGMVPFKRVFLGEEKRDYQRACSAQKCLRAGGKHNDLDNVGRTARHHTFFEMLGNFGFADYGKEQAIKMAWAFLTEYLSLPKDRLIVTVYQDDDEAFDIWKDKMSVPEDRIIRCGKADNFWSMGDTGPCGPCTEIFYDHGPEIAGGPPGSADAEGDRFVEIWNVVFMQYNRSKDGKLNPLPKLSVDTGMGLERIAAVMQGVHDNYLSDLFQPLIQKMDDLSGHSLPDVTLRVIADHLRSTAFLMADGVCPSNEGRGYVLRRIMRRAISKAYQAGYRKPFFAQLLPTLIQLMAVAYPRLKDDKTNIARLMDEEAKQFAQTYEQGLTLLEAAMQSAKSKVLSGQDVFRLYDTYGFPVDLTSDIAESKGYRVDQKGFEVAMEAQRTRSREHQAFSAVLALPEIETFSTAFTGYDTLQSKAKVLAIYQEEKLVDQLDNSSEMAWIVLDQTPFYAEGGGQVGDKGQLRSDQASFEVEDTQRLAEVFLHCGKLVSGKIKPGDYLEAQVDASRMDSMRNHTATHLLHGILRDQLGKSVEQKGSLVEPARLRFDFSYPSALDKATLLKIERRVNEAIRANFQADIQHCTFDEAKKKGAIALFGEKYTDKVRVCRYGDVSIELCGGTHVKATGEIGAFKILSETGIAAGIRRIEAITGAYVDQWMGDQDTKWMALASDLKAMPDKVHQKVKALMAEKKTLDQELSSLRSQQGLAKAASLWDKRENLADTACITEHVQLDQAKVLAALIDDLRARSDRVVVALVASLAQDKHMLIVGLSPACKANYSAKKLLQIITAITGGSGGGRDDFAQGVLKDLSRLPEAFQQLKDHILQQKVS